MLKTTAITEAITIIDQIAFQTNILSLNAAVEAATSRRSWKRLLLLHKRLEH